MDRKSPLFFREEREEDINLSKNSMGSLKVMIRSAVAFVPIEGARVEVALMKTQDGKAQEGSKVIESTDESGEIKEIFLEAPARELSQNPGTIRPYAEYMITVSAEGFIQQVIRGVQIFSDETAVQVVKMMPMEGGTSKEEQIQIGEHTLYGEYPAKIPEEEIKPIEDTGEIVLSRVVIPEYVIVHDGAPTDTGAKDYWVTYKDYIKNVASSEIYSTWPEATIYANILAIMSFTLNRVYTEWYRNKGYSFTITSSTAYDQKWIYGRNTYQNIDRLVDSVFANYLSKPSIRQPLFASYCDGKRVTCKGLSQWGSKYLGDEGYSAIEILRYYYGSEVYINTSTQIAGVPSSYPGYNLKIGSSGDKVRQLQRQLNAIGQNFPAIPKLSVDGKYGTKTAEAVRVFQGVFNLPQTGITDYATWYSISNVYVGVTRIAEP